MSKGKKNFPYAVREFIDADYLSRLSKEEREWYYRFQDEYYNNNHRSGEIVSKSKNYEKGLKQKLDGQNNASRRDFYSNSTRVTVRNNDLNSIIYESYSEDILESLKLKGLEKTVIELVEDKALDFKQDGLKLEVEDIKQELSKLCMDVTKAVQLERKYRKNKRRKS